MSLLDGLRSIIGSALSGIFLDATLTRVTKAAGPNGWTPGEETTTTYACKAIHEEYGSSWLAGGLVEASDRKVLILASTLSVDPLPGDKITIRGETFQIVPAGGGKAPVTTDPAKACWECRARK